MVVVDKKTKKPGVCALVIGVGAYDRSLEEAYKMSADLSSATISALRFAGWVSSELNSPVGEVQYLDVVVSEAPNTDPAKLGQALKPLQKRRPSWKCEAANSKRVVEAVHRWHAACDRNKGNVAILYYCGHGIEIKGVVSLFTEDFDAYKKEWVKLIDIKRLFQASAQFKSKDKYFFIDTCRDVPDALDDYDSIPSHPILATINDRTHLGDARLWIASDSSERAWGFENDVSQFTSAMLSSLNGAAAEMEPVGKDDKWAVRSPDVIPTIGKLLAFRKRIAEESGTEFRFQEPFELLDSSSAGEVLHIPGEHAVIPSKISWEPADTDLVIRPSNGTPKPRHLPKGSPELRDDLPLGSEVTNHIYTFEGTRNGEPLAAKPEQETIVPPYFEVTISFE